MSARALKAQTFWPQLSSASALPRPTFTGMTRKPANTDLRVEARSVEKNRRRLRTRKPPAPIQPLGIDAATQCRIREIIALAVAAPVTAAEFKAALAKWPPPARPAPPSLVVMPFGYLRDRNVRRAPRRRLSLSHPERSPCSAHADRWSPSPKSSGWRAASITSRGAR
jgi:hypothetical protein